MNNTKQYPPSGISAWLDWSNLSSKISRYSASTVDLENLILWWDSMSIVQKASPVIIGKLVATGRFVCGV